MVICNTRSWALDFISTENGRDITIPPSVTNWSKLTVAEIEGQIQEDNKMFSGTDGIGNNAYIKILDDDIRRCVFHLDEDDKSTVKILDLTSVKALLEIKDKETFMRELEKLVVTNGDKKMIVELANKADLDSAQVYKKTAIEALANTAK